MTACGTRISIRKSSPPAPSLPLPPLPLPLPPAPQI